MRTMRNLLTVILFTVVFSPAASAELVWNGGAGVRHVIRSLNDGLETKDALNRDSSITRNKRWEYRGGLGVLSRSDSWDLGFDVRTAGSVTSEWVTANGAGDFGIGISQAFGRYKDSVLGGEWTVTLGRHRTVILHDNMAQMLFDNDNRFDGFGWTFRHGMFGLNLAQYVLGATQLGASSAASTYSYTEASEAIATTRSHFGVLYSFQPFIEFNLGEDIKSVFAVAFHAWSGTGGNGTTGWFNNNVHGGTAGTVGDVTTVSLDDARQWQLLSDTSLPFKFRFVAEYIRNKKVFYGTRTPATATTRATDNDALALSLGWGKPKKAGEFGLAYSYSDKGIGSVISSFTNGDIPPDNISHFFEAKYMVADSLSLAGKAQFHKEKGKVGGDGLALISPNEKRNQTQKRFEFIGSVAF